MAWVTCSTHRCQVITCNILSHSLSISRLFSFTVLLLLLSLVLCLLPLSMSLALTHAPANGSASTSFSSVNQCSSWSLQVAWIFLNRKSRSSQWWTILPALLLLFLLLCRMSRHRVARSELFSLWSSLVASSVLWTLNPLHVTLGSDGLSLMPPAGTERREAKWRTTRSKNEWPEEMDNACKDHLDGISEFIRVWRKIKAGFRLSQLDSTQLPFVWSSFFFIPSSLQVDQYNSLMLNKKM